MGILRADNLQKSFGTRTLFRDVSFEIQPGERVGLIGVNGSGKTTLFRILLGKERADNGIVSLAPSARITEVEQRPDTAQDVDLFHFTLEAFSELLETERTLNEIVSRIDREPEQRSRLIARQDVLLETFDRR